MSDDFQSRQQHQQERAPQTAAQRDDRATTQTPHASSDVALWAKMGLPPPKPTYCTPNIPCGLQNLSTIYQEATVPKTRTKWEKDLDSLLMI